MNGAPGKSAPMTAGAVAGTRIRCMNRYGTQIYEQYGSYGPTAGKVFTTHTARKLGNGDVYSYDCRGVQQSTIYVPSVYSRTSVSSNVLTDLVLPRLKREYYLD
jgi:hypothetical protein